MTVPAKLSMPGIDGVWLGQEARRGDQVAGVSVRHRRRGDVPHRGVLIPARTLDHGVESHVPPDVVLVGDISGVLFDFGAGGEQPRPPGSARRSTNTWWWERRPPVRGSG